MKIRLLSDIHQEFYEDKNLYKTQGEDVLVLAGDIGVGMPMVSGALVNFLKEQKNIVYVPGNHEYYGSTIQGFNKDMAQMCKALGVHFLNPGYVKIGEVSFIGACGWTNFQKDAVAKMIMPSRVGCFKAIKGFTTDKCEQLSTEHFKYLFDTYSAAEGKKVIITHFLPALECVAPEYRDETVINKYFANDYGDRISYMQDITWLFGHTHSNVDLTLGDVRVVANPYGYYRNPIYQEKIINV